VSAELLTLLRIDESDLAANRAGQMGEHQHAMQQTNARRLKIAAVGGGVLFALLALLLVIQSNGAWPLMIAVGAGWVLPCLDVNGKSCLVQTPVSFDVDRWRSAIGPGSARVYVFGGPKIPKVVGIEPAAG
jgi:hypothetical protein